MTFFSSLFMAIFIAILSVSVLFQGCIDSMHANSTSRSLDYDFYYAKFIEAVNRELGAQIFLESSFCVRYEE